ncbi:hypothetical protein [uncultured Clostridium sp.]|uniref:hypothetical protein n=2 Tax=Clostridiaceae TaxID=31979 RepID=UPI0025FBDE6E|nr:hypothetical protein [uncultured Clostridium sp.]
MTFFEDEKKRINKYYHKFYLGIFLFIYFINVQSNVSYEITAIKNGADMKAIPFINSTVVLGSIILIIYLNYHLFWIKEQGKKIFILRKYDIIPLSKKEIYYSKFRIIINNFFGFLFGAMIIYIGILLFNSYYEFNIINNILDILKILLFSGVLIGVVLVINLFEDYNSKRCI